MPGILDRLAPAVAAAVLCHRAPVLADNDPIDVGVDVLCRHRRGLRLCRCDPRRLVAPDGRLRDQPLDRRSPDAGRAPPGWVHHSDRVLLGCGLVGSMGRRGNPYDNAKTESFMKTLKVEAV
jgi:hypothetical protein